MRVRILLIVLLFVSATSMAATIHVPADQPTVQAGIQAALYGDTVLVAPGIYHENIDFHGKAVVVLSSGGRRVTTLYGVNSNAPVVAFKTNEPDGAEISGFTITHGFMAGIYCKNSSPTISNNELFGNINGPGFDGGGIDMTDCRNGTIKGNIFHHNTAITYGGAVHMVTCSSMVICYNISFANDAYSEFRGVTSTGFFYNNTVSITRSAGLELRIGGNFVARNNIIFFSKESAALWSSAEELGVIDAKYNCLFDNEHVSDFTLDPTNLKIYARFSDTLLGDYSLLPGSPCIEAGDPDPDYNDKDGSRNDIGALPFGTTTGPELQPLLYVPADRATIQEAVNDIRSGGYVYVTPGIYQGGIDIFGKAVRLVATGGPDSTTIVGDPAVDLITLNGPVTSTSRIEGFMFSGGRIGIHSTRSRPTIRRNLFDSQAGGTGQSGAIVMDDPQNQAGFYSPTIIENNTIVHCLQSGIVNNSMDTPEIRNNIVAFNGQYGVFAGNAVLSAYNDVFDNLSGNWSVYDSGAGTISVDPLFGIGYHLTESSPCRDAGDPAAKYREKDGSRNDMGAFAFICCTGQTRGNVNGMGEIDLADLAMLVSYLIGGAPPPPCWGLADLSGNGMVDLADLALLTTYLTSTGGTVTLPPCQ